MKSGFSPAPCSPLRRLRAYSAELVRAPPYIKVERENRPPAAIRRYSQLIIGRARHKLKRARQVRRIYRGFCIRIVHARRAALVHARQYIRGFAAVCGAAAAFLIPHSAFRIPHSEFRISNPAFPSPSPQKKGGASPSRLFWLSGLLLIVLFILGAQFYRGLVPAGLFQTVEVAVQLAPDMVRAVFAHYRPHGIYVGIALLHLVFLPFKD